MTAGRAGREAGHIAPRPAPEEPPGHRRLARFVGAVGLLVLTAALFWMLTDEAFTVRPESMTFEGLAYADEAQVRARLRDLDRGPNVFRVRASEIVSELSTLPEVDAAFARVTVPARLAVRLDERDPVFVWSNGAVAWLVDEGGMLFAPAERAAATEEALSLAGDSGAALRAALPVVDDRRLPDEAPGVGSYLPAQDVEVIRLLLAVTPESLGSGAEELYLRIDEENGYVLSSSDFGWRAIFGHYTPTLGSPDEIPRQVQCLRWRLARVERRLEQIWLAPTDEACGTWTDFDDGEGRSG